VAVQKNSESDANREMKYPAGAKADVPFEAVFGTTKVMP
jgi:hypothetical protein